MKNTIILILLLAITSVARSQVTTMYNGVWMGEAKNKDTSFVVKFSILSNGAKVQKNTLIGGVIMKPEFCGIEENRFNDSILQLKPYSKYELKPAIKDIAFKGMLTQDKNKMSGDFTYRGKVYKLDLRRGTKVILRPQEPKKPFPYISEEIKFANKKDSVILAGTLTIPKKEGCYPAVILISGSMPSNRNGSSNYHQMLLVLADYLTRNGIAVLRYDSRGVNESSGDFYTSTPDDFARDIIAGYNLLCARKEIDKRKIGLIGHSGGGIVASIAASVNPNIGFVILMAGLGIPGKADYVLQDELKLNTGDLTSDHYAFKKEFYSRGYTMIEEGYDKKVITDTLSKFINRYASLFPTPASGPNIDKFNIGELFRFMIKSLLSPNNCFYFKCHPSEYLEKVTCPVLSLNGSKDILVPAKINQNAIREALTKGGNPDFTILELEGLNHSFQECETGSIKESLEMEQTISPKALSVITEWILKHSNELKTKLH